VLSHTPSSILKGGGSVGPIENGRVDKRRRGEEKREGKGCDRGGIDWPLNMLNWRWRRSGAYLHRPPPHHNFSQNERRKKRRGRRANGLPAAAQRGVVFRDSKSIRERRGGREKRREGWRRDTPVHDIGAQAAACAVIQTTAREEQKKKKKRERGEGPGVSARLARGGARYSLFLAGTSPVLSGKGEKGKKKGKEKGGTATRSAARNPNHFPEQSFSLFLPFPWRSLITETISSGCKKKKGGKKKKRRGKGKNTNRQQRPKGGPPRT